MIKEGQEVYRCIYCKELFLHDNNYKKIYYDGKVKSNILKPKCPYCGSSEITEHGLNHIKCKK